MTYTSTLVHYDNSGLPDLLSGSKPEYTNGSGCYVAQSVCSCCSKSLFSVVPLCH